MHWEGADTLILYLSFLSFSNIILSILFRLFAAIPEAQIRIVMAQSSTVSGVFSIPELLHEVLSYLPQTCLLVTVPLVCKSWSMAVTSPGLERALWFRPAIRNGPSTWSSLLEKQFSILFDFSLISTGHVLDPAAFDALPWKRNVDAFVCIYFPIQGGILSILLALNHHNFLLIPIIYDLKLSWSEIYLTSFIRLEPRQAGAICSYFNHPAINL